MLNLQYHCRTLMDIWEHALYWCETLILMERGIDTPSLRLLQDASTNTRLYWLRCIEGGQFRLGISETYWRKKVSDTTLHHWDCSKTMPPMVKGLTPFTCFHWTYLTAFDYRDMLSSSKLIRCVNRNHSIVVIWITMLMVLMTTTMMTEEDDVFQLSMERVERAISWRGSWFGWQ